MKRFYFLALFLCGVLSTAFAQPANDDCANAIEIFKDTIVNFTTIDATTDGPIVGCLGANDSIPNDIWYTWTAEFTGEAKWSNCGTADYDSRIAIYAAGVMCDNLAGNEAFCNDDGPTSCSAAAFTSEVIFPVTEGEVYLLRLGGYADDDTPSTSGSGTIVLTQSFGPDNNFCEAAIEVSLGETAWDNTNATTDGPEHPDNPCFQFGDNTVQTDIWYTFTADADGTIEWSTCDIAGGVDTRMAVYPATANCPFTDEDLYACNDDGAGCPNFSSLLFFDVTAGSTYYLRLGGFGGDQGAGLFTLTNTTPPPVPENNDCLAPTPVMIVSADAADMFEGTNVGTTIGADFNSVDYLFPPCLGNQAGGEFADVWYAFNSLGNTTIEARMFSQTPEASFYFDLFTACGTQVDEMVVGGSCFLTDPDNTVVFDTITNLDPTPADYLIRITTRLTSDIPGEFFFQLVADSNTTVSYEFIPVANDMKFFPNPAKDNAQLQFTLAESKDLALEVYNTLGQRAMQLPMQSFAQGENYLELDLSDLVPGLYFLEVRTDRERQTIKFFKE